MGATRHGLACLDTGPGAKVQQVRVVHGLRGDGWFVRRTWAPRRAADAMGVARCASQTVCVKGSHRVNKTVVANGEVDGKHKVT